MALIPWASHCLNSIKVGSFEADFKELKKDLGEAKKSIDKTNELVSKLDTRRKSTRIQLSPPKDIKVYWAGNEYKGKIAEYTEDGKGLYILPGTNAGISGSIQLGLSDKVINAIVIHKIMKYGCEGAFLRGIGVSIIGENNHQLILDYLSGETNMSSNKRI